MFRQTHSKNFGIRSVLSVLFLICASLMAGAQQYSFTSSGLKLNGATIFSPTSIQFGPDNRLYVSEQAGWIRIYTIRRNGPNDYSVTGFETITVVNDIPNHDDNGALNPNVNRRQVTGIVVRGTAANPIIYVSSSDSRIGGPSGETNLDTNSGMVSMLTWNGNTWVKLDLVRGLPRSEENHAVNGMQLDDQTNTLFLAVGGHTNAGAPSTNFDYLTEYAYSGAIVSINLNTIMAMPTKGSGNNSYKYDLPTLDDPTRANNADGTDVGDPFGGNDGLNQAMLVPGGPVQIYASGLRNAYDLLLTKSRKLYTIDNGANPGWGGYPAGEGTANVTNNYVSGEPGSTSPTANHAAVNNLDNFHYVCDIDNYTPGAFYGGHPNPVRANPAGAGLYTTDGPTGVFRTSKTGSNPLPANWPPVPASMADPREAYFKMPGTEDGSPLTFQSSTNGLAEYTASNFGGALKGKILACEYNGAIALIKLTADGTGVTNAKDPVTKMNQDPAFADNFGATPLDLIAQGDNDIYPGTVWALTYGGNAITIFEPQEANGCTGANNTSDEDGDGFTNADEISNGTNPCSASSKPADFDGDSVSDLNDPDDDNDGISDKTDFFAIDAANGRSTSMPINYDLFNNYPGTGFFGLGFTGLMTNYSSDYGALFNRNNLVAGGAVGAFSIDNVSAGDALGSLNTQQNAFQFGVQTSGLPFTLKGRILGPFFNNGTPQGSMSQGIFIGNGDQDNYLKIVLNANGGAGGIQVVYENSGTPTTYQYAISGGIPSSTLDLILKFNPSNNSVQAAYAANNGTVINVGSPIIVGGSVLNALRGNAALAVGIIATSKGGTSFTAAWDYLYMTGDAVSSAGTWTTLTPSSGNFTPREENAYVQAGNKFYLMGGRGNKPVQEYNPVTKAWVDKAYQPMELHHFQAVTLDGLVYVVGAFTGAYPHETPVPNIYLYNPAANAWYTGGSIPAARRRGAGGAVVYNNKIYLVGGITDGHWAGWVKWFDEYDPATNTWRTLPDAPHERDHVQVSIVNGKLYVAGGRRSSASTGQDFDFVVPEVDVYDFAAGTWTTLPASANIPTPRSGASNVTVGNEVVVIGGESAAQVAAHVETEAFNVTTNTWRRLANLQQGRHGTQAIANNGGIFTAAGPGNRGGTPLLTTQESFYFYTPTTIEGTAISAGSVTVPGSFSFGTTSLNAANTKQLVLTNSSGNQGIVITGIAQSGSSAFTYSAPALPFVIAPGGSISINVTFLPTSGGSQTASLSFSTTGQSGTISSTLNGFGASVLYRVNAGGPQLNTSMGTFSADMKFDPSPGTTASSSNAIAGTTDDALYQTERNGTSFDYDFPVTNGQYNVVVHFAETSVSSIGARKFDVLAESQVKLDNYDIFAKAGANTARTETFSVNVTDGLLNLRFNSAAANGGAGLAKVCAIEILSGAVANEPPVASAGADKAITLPTNTVVLSGSGTDAGGSIAAYNWTQVSGPNLATFSSKTVATPTLSGLEYGIYVFQLVVTDNQGANSAPDQVTVVVNGAPGSPQAQSTVRINGGGGVLNTSLGTFAKDTLFQGNNGGPAGSPASTTNAISGTVDPALYQTYHYGYEFGYTIPVNNGQYRIVLHFAETYWNDTGKRKFDVLLKNQTVLDDYDIYAKVGANKATTESFTVIISDRTINIDFLCKTLHGGVDNALICGIEILPVTTSSTGNQLPVANAGPDKNITLPTASVGLAGSGTDADGTIAGYTWSQVSGPNTATFSSKTMASPSVSGLVQGTYTFALVVTDNQGASSAADQVTVTVSPSNGNAVPVANAGADQFITLPTSSVILGGTGTDSDGSISSYTWSQVSGPNTATFSSNSASNPTVSGLVQGTYTFALVVKDNAGASSAPDQVVVTVNAGPGAGNTTLRINAGGPQLTTSIGTFSADNYYTGSNGGTYSTASAIGGTSNGALYQTERWGYNFGYAIPVTNGQYRVVLHFAEIYFTTTNSRVFDVSIEGAKKLDNYDIVAKVGGFTATTETFTVTVTDGTLNIDFSSLGIDGGKDNAKISAIEVLPATAANQVPVANAGPDKTLTLPTSSVVLNGAGTDADGTIAGYTWTQVSGPNTATFSSKTVAAPTVSGLVQGSYVFALTVTDNAGAVSTADQVTVTVNAAAGSNAVPVANAGPDKTIALPGNALVLTGSGTDADGTIAGYIWSQVSGPNTATFSSNSASNPTVSGLVQGTYVFALVVNDNQGAASAADQVSVTVNAMIGYSGSTTVRYNSAGPQVQATIGTFSADNRFSPAPGTTLSTTSSIAGTADAVLYQTARWGGAFSYSVPVTNGRYRVVLHFAEIQNTTAGSRMFDVTMEGALRLDNYDIYAKVGANTATTEAFTVTVTDGMMNINFDSSPAIGGKGYALVSAVEILPAPSNQAPVANAGADQSVTLPGSSVTLSGSGTDADGTIASYAWTQVSGPNTAAFSSNSASNPTVSGLVQGTYTFALVVKDNAGASSAPDQVVVTVSPATATRQIVSSFTLVNADTDADIMALTDGATINLATLPTRNLNIRANCDPTTVGSVQFSLAGTATRNVTETAGPYALFGDASGDYSPWTPATGSYTLKATPYTGAGATGSAGTALTLNFTVTNSAPLTKSTLGTPAPLVLAGKQAPAKEAAGLEAVRVKVYPNPSTAGRVQVQFSEAVQGEFHYTLYSGGGSKTLFGREVLSYPSSIITLDLSRAGLKPGVYHLELQQGAIRKTVQLVLVDR